MSKKAEKGRPIEEGLIRAMQALDSQIARSMSRDPAEREVHGVQKWEPITERVERICVLVMNALGDNEIDLDSVLVLSQAFPKVLALVSEDLGREGMGEVRTGYCLAAADSFEADCEKVRSVLKGPANLM